MARVLTQYIVPQPISHVDSLQSEKLQKHHETFPQKPYTPKDENDVRVLESDERNCVERIDRQDDSLFYPPESVDIGPRNSPLRTSADRKYLPKRPKIAHYERSIE